jgi:hypothetical protein
MQVVQPARIDMQPDSAATQKRFNMLGCNVYANAIFFYTQRKKRRKHKQYEAARLDEICVTLRLGTIIVTKNTPCIPFYI